MGTRNNDPIIQCPFPFPFFWDIVAGSWTLPYDLLPLFLYPFHIQSAPHHPHRQILHSCSCLFSPPFCIQITPSCLNLPSSLCSSPLFLLVHSRSVVVSWSGFKSPIHYLPDSTRMVDWLQFFIVSLVRTINATQTYTHTLVGTNYKYLL